MTLKTFTAPTMAEALAQVKSVMGHDAVILHTRTYQRSLWLGLRRREIVEITAGRGLNLLPRRTPAKPQVPVQRPPVAYAAAAPKNGNYAKQVLETPVANRAMMFDLSEQVQCIKSMVKDLTTQVRQQQKPQLPEELFEHYTQFINNQVCDELAIEIVLAIQKQLRPEQLQQQPLVKERLADYIEKLIATTGAIRRTKSSGPHIVALIGPTGVGKTTTIAKLAANLKVREKKRVGLITIDTFRMAAIDQLKKYAEILGSNLCAVSSPNELKNAVEQLGDCDFILIDTAGRSPNDALKLHELQSFLASAAPDETHLVLSTTASQACIELAVERFSEIKIDRMIFTKLDEAAHVGVVLNVLRKINKPLSYITTGQDVPDDIEVGRARRLAQLILGDSL